MNVSVVIPNWNGEDLLAKNLPKVIKAKKNRDNHIKEIIVVDDCSTDGSQKFLEKKFKGEVVLVKHTMNRGFSSAVNTGVRTAKSKLVCLLNTDVAPHEDFLVHVLRHFHSKQTFAISFNEGKLGPAVGKFTNGYLEHKALESKETKETLWVSGGSGIFSRKIWISLRGLDEQMFNPFYWEDVDISYRAWKRGYELYWEPKAKVAHNHESTINPEKIDRKKIEITRERNELLFIWKNVTSKRLFRKHIYALFTRTRMHPGYLKVVFAALKKARYVSRARKREQNEATVADEIIFAKFDF